MIAREYSRFAAQGDEPYYPINRADDREKMAAYKQLAREQAPNVMFGGRLGMYKYFDMHMAIGSALAHVDSIVAPYFERRAAAGSGRVGVERGDGVASSDAGAGMYVGTDRATTAGADSGVSGVAATHAPAGGANTMANFLH